MVYLKEFTKEGKQKPAFTLYDIEAIASLLDVMTSKTVKQERVERSTS